MLKMRLISSLMCWRRPYRLPQLHQVIFDCREKPKQVRKAKRLDKLDYLGRTILHIAAMRGNHRAIALIVEESNKRGMQTMLIDIKDKEGNTALHLASESGCKVSIGLLVKAGCDLTILNKRGELPLRWALNFHVNDDDVQNVGTNSNNGRALENDATCLNATDRPGDVSCGGSSAGDLYPNKEAQFSGEAFPVDVFGVTDGHETQGEKKVRGDVIGENLLSVAQEQDLEDPNGRHKGEIVETSSAGQAHHSQSLREMQVSTELTGAEKIGLNLLTTASKDDNPTPRMEDKVTGEQLGGETSHSEPRPVKSEVDCTGDIIAAGPSLATLAHQNQSSTRDSDVNQTIRGMNKNQGWIAARMLHRLQNDARITTTAGIIWIFAILLFVLYKLACEQ